VSVAFSYFLLPLVQRYCWISYPLCRDMCPSPLTPPWRVRCLQGLKFFLSALPLLTAVVFFYASVRVSPSTLWPFFLRALGIFFLLFMSVSSESFFDLLAFFPPRFCLLLLWEDHLSATAGTRQPQSKFFPPARYLVLFPFHVTFFNSDVSPSDFGYRFL